MNSNDVTKSVRQTFFLIRNTSKLTTRYRMRETLKIDIPNLILGEHGVTV